nr:glycosyltransferase [Campylobacter sp. MIT 19-121]
MGGGLCVKFISFTQQDFLAKLRFYTPTLSFSFKQFFIKRWTHMAFARFEALNLLDECKNIVYLDFDCLILKDISELFKLRLPLAADRGLNTFKDENLKEYFIFRTPILSFNDRLKNPKKLYEHFYKIIAKHHEAEDFNDQVAFSMLIHKNKLKVKMLNKNKYSGQIFYRASRNSSIIHAYGSKNRFWNNALCKKTWPLWWQYYEKWLKLGGSAYTGGIVALNTQSKERFRFHLSYKLGYAVIRLHRSFFGWLQMPFVSFVLLYILFQHKKERKIYEQELQQNANAKLPKLSEYEDFEQGLKETQTKSYKIGQRLIKIFQFSF